MQAALGVCFVGRRKSWIVLCVRVSFWFSDKAAGERELCSGTELVLDAGYLKLISANEEVLNLLWEKELPVP